MLDALNRYANGFVIIPVVCAVRQRGLFSLLHAGPVARDALARRLDAHDGYLAVALDLLGGLGWTEESPSGEIVLAACARPDAVPDGLLDAYRIDWPAFGSEMVELLERLLPFVERGWDVDLPIAGMLSGPIAVPLLQALFRRDAFDAKGVSPSLPPVVHRLVHALGWTDHEGQLTELGMFLAERGFAAGAVGSYASLLNDLPELIFGAPGDVMGRAPDGSERHVDRTANVLASGFQHQRYFDDFDVPLGQVFDLPDPGRQPRVVVDTGCGDGALLRRVWETMGRSRRAAHLDTHPLLLVGIDFNDAALRSAALTLDGLPHLLLHGDIGDPAGIRAQLTARGIDADDILHIRSFLDHDRPWQEPATQRQAPVIPAACTVVRPDGSLIPAAAVVQSLVEHLQRWAGVVGRHGLLLLEVHRLPPASVAALADQTESLHFDAYHGFSNQQLVTAQAFLLASAEAGLFGAREAFRKYPRVEPFARIQLQHFRRHDWRLRQAGPADLAALLALEAICLPPALRHATTLLQARLAEPNGIFVAERDGAILGAVHVQRIAGLDALRATRWDGLAGLRLQDGKALQLLALVADPASLGEGIGDTLVDFILQWASLTPGIELVCGVTRCRDWDGIIPYASWVGSNGPDGLPDDATLRFHVGRGARIMQVMQEYRPEDVANAGHGVLIAYPLSPAGTISWTAGGDVGTAVEACIRAVMRSNRHGYDRTLALRDMGLDSADLLELRALLGRRLGLRLDAAFFFSHPTPERIIEALSEPRVVAEPRTAEPAFVAEPAHDAIAVIGMSCRLPGAPDLPAFEALLEQGLDGTGPVPASRWAAPDGQRGGFLDGVDLFDPGFFQISPREAQTIDPQQRLLLEVAHEALEHAFQPVDSLRGSRTGIFLGLHAQDWAQRLLASGHAPDGHFSTGTSNAIAAGRLAYVFGLRGPALVINTACSSSLVAIHLACQSLRRNESRLALAGGANLILDPVLSQAFEEAGMLAPDGVCKPFDATADGYVRAEGVGIVVLKRLDQAMADGDRILAVIRGSAINNDGASNGLTAPSLQAQHEVITAALDDASLAGSDIDVVEAHGTGTRLGDPVEIEALAASYGGSRTAPLVVTAVKGAIGHAEAAAGIAGLIKAVVSLRGAYVPGILNYRTPNPEIRTGALRFAARSQPWPERADASGSHAAPRRMGVSAFGFSGTNAHVILEQAPPPLEALPIARMALPLSARDEAGLRRLAAHWAPALRSLSDATVASRRRLLPWRAAVTGSSVEELRRGLNGIATGPTPPGPMPVPRIGFLFSGQGSQYVGMGLALHASDSRFRHLLDRADIVLQPLLGRSLVSVLSDEALHNTAYAQPALCAIQIALVHRLAACGIRPDAVLGHSVGEIAAAHAAGVLSFEEALRLAATRGRIMASLPAGGAMLSLRTDATHVGMLLAGIEQSVSIAAVNGPQSVVVSGTEAAIATVTTRAAEAGISAVALRVSHAFHSPLMDGAQAPYAEALHAFSFAPARLPIHSTLTGDTTGNLTDPDYHVRQIRAPVLFARALATMECDILIEIGPQPILGRLARDQLAIPCMQTLTPGGDMLADMLAALHRLGAMLIWSAGFTTPGADSALPPTPFAGRRFWIDPSETKVSPTYSGAGTVLGQRLHLPGLEEARWQARIEPATARFFEDHRLHGQVVVPAASHIATALTALRALGLPTSLTDLVFRSPLRLSEGKPRLAQLIVGQQSVRLVTAPDTLDDAAGATAWTTHLEASPAEADGLVPAPDLAGCHERIDGPAFYEGFAAAGYTFGPAMRGIDAIFVQSADATGDLAGCTLIETATSADPSSGLAIDVALLDAAFQLQGFWFDTENCAASGQIFVPYSIAHLTLHDALPGHATTGPYRAVARRLREKEPDARSRIADVWLMDGNGRIMLEARHFQFRLAARAALIEPAARPHDADGDGIGRLLHRLDWQDAKVRALPSPAALAARLASPPAMPDNGADQAMMLRHQAAAWVGSAFSQAGWPLRPGQRLDEAMIAERLSVSPARHDRIRGLLAALRNDGVLDGAGLVLRPGRDMPRRLDSWFPALSLLEQTGPHLLGILQGRIDPLTLLFPLSDPSLVTRVYEQDPAFVAANQVMAEAVRLLDRDRLDVLELGGGTGATTAAVLPALRSPHYWFTDLTPHFLPAAALRFPAVSTAVLDIEAEAGELGGRRFDLVLAANMLHATRDLPASLRRVGKLLRPGGRLLLLEGTGQPAWVDLTFGLLDGWHRHSTGPSPRAHTLLDPLQWRDVLAEAGFESEAVPASGGSFPQHLLIAQRRETGTWRVSGQGVFANRVRKQLDIAGNLADSGPSDGLLICASDQAPAIAAFEALQAATATAAEPVWLVTEDAVAAADRDPVTQVEAAASWGIGRTARLEHPEFDLRLLDIAQGNSLQALPALLADPGPARELALREPGLPGASFRVLASRLVPAPDLAAATPFRPDPEGSYLITGGLGGLGLRLAAWLAQHGARHLVLAGRRPLADAALLAPIREAGAKIEIRLVDVGDPAALGALVESVRPRGLFHLAGVLEDAALHRLDREGLLRALAPKAEAALTLDRLSAGIELFVLFGSAASLLGNPGQTAHGAANAVLTALAQRRHAHGLHALCVDWGAWGEVGTVAKHNPFRGMRRMPPDDCLAALARLLGGDVAHAAIMDIEPEAPLPVAVGRDATLLDLDALPWNTRRTALLGRLQRDLATVLAMPADEPLDPRQGFFTLGLDSLTSLDFRNRVQAAIGKSLPATMAFDHPNLEALASFLLGPAPQAPEAAPSQETLTIDDARALIERELVLLGLSEPVS